MGDLEEADVTGRRWLPSEALPNRVPPRECVAAARRALDKTYPLGQGTAAIPLLIEAVDWLRRALEQMQIEDGVACPADPKEQT